MIYEPPQTDKYSQIDPFFTDPFCYFLYYMSIITNFSNISTLVKNDLPKHSISSIFLSIPIGSMWFVYCFKEAGSSFKMIYEPPRTDKYSQNDPFLLTLFVIFDAICLFLLIFQIYLLWSKMTYLNIVFLGFF